MPKVKPLHNIVIVEKEKDPQYSAGGIKLPKVPKFFAMVGKVVAVGPGVTLDDGTKFGCNVEVGDRIAYDITHQKTFDIGGEDVVMVKANGIFGKIPPSDS